MEAAHAALAGVNRYPDPQATELRRALSAHLDVPVEQILAGNGSVEIIDLVARALLGKPVDTEVKVQVPKGIREFEILEIRYD